MTTDRSVSGISVSPGVVVGPALVIGWDLPSVPRRIIDPGEVGGEIRRLREAVHAVRVRFEDLRDRTRQRAGEEEAKIFDTHLLMLADEEFLSGVEELIRENHLGAEQAFEFKTLEIKALWSQSPSARLRERVTDLTGLQVRVLGHLLGEPAAQDLERVGGRPAVVMTRELSPGITVEFDKEHVAAFVSEGGTRTSHASIIARSLGIPTVVGWRGDTSRIRHGVTVIVDATRGTVIVEPTDQEIEEFRRREARWVELKRELERAVGQPAVTLDGTPITLRCNLDLPEELNVAVEHGAEGVGLLRTEFLVLGRAKLPGEDEQASYFGRVAERFSGRPVVIRSYDLGGDKFPAHFRHAGDPNPFLGWRAIRVCLDEPDIFLTQLRALLRARVHGDVRLMLPLVTGLEEIEAAAALVQRAARELEERGVPSAGELPIGVMVETPAAALLVERILAEGVFVSVGTNDLTQYTLAVDRGNARLAARFDPLHPAMVRSLDHIARAAAAAGEDVSICGEMAADPESALLLLGLGYRTLSVSPPRLPQIRWLIRRLDLDAARQAAREALEARTGQEIRRRLEQTLADFVDLELLEEYRLPATQRRTTFKS